MSAPVRVKQGREIAKFLVFATVPVLGTYALTRPGATEYILNTMGERYGLDLHGNDHRVQQQRMEELHREIRELERASKKAV